MKYKEMILSVLFFLSFNISIYILFIYFNLIIINKSNVNLMGIILSSIVTPIIEEYIFRYMPYKLLKVNKYFIVIMSTLLFTLFHGKNIYESIIIFSCGLSLSIIYLKTNDIKNCIISHGIWNLIMNLIAAI